MELGFQRVVQLKQLSDTRWLCRYSSIKAIMSTINALISTLEQISDESSSRSVEARGLLHQVKDFSFLLSLVLFEMIFGITSNLSNFLQAEQLSYACVANCIRAAKMSLADLRSNEAWVKVWDKTTTLAESCGVSVTPMRPWRSHKMPQQLLNSFVVDSAIVTGRETPVEAYRTHVYYASIDVLLQEMDKRFSELNLSLLASLEALVPTSNVFLGLSTLRPILSHYNISETAMETEIAIAKTYLRKCDGPSLHQAYSLLRQVPECFPTTLQCYQIAMTMGVSSASAERSFSSLRRLKTYLRSTMSQDRLSNLALLYIERDLSSQLWEKLDDLVIRFAETHRNSKIVLL